MDDLNGQPPIRIIVAGDDVQFKEFLENYVEFLDLAPDNDSNYSNYNSNAYEE